MRISLMTRYFYAPPAPERVEKKRKTGRKACIGGNERRRTGGKQTGRQALDERECEGQAGNMQEGMHWRRGREK
jgi:hypothetical protein